MGSLHLRLLPLLAAALVPAHAIAQQGGGSVQDFRLDPTLDPNRPKPPEQEGPEVDNRPAPVLPSTQPTEAAPPVVQPPIAQPPVPQPQVAPPPVVRPVPTPALSRPERAPETPAPRVEPAPTTPPVETTPPPAELPTVVPPALENASRADPTTDVAPVVPPASTLPWLWIIIGLLVAAGLVAFLLLRRRSSCVEDEVYETAEPTAATEPPVPAAPEASFTVPAPPMAMPAIAPAARLSLEFEAIEARTSIVAATIGYRLTIRNEGAVDAENVVVAAVMANAEAKQEQTLARFFASPTDAPTHQIGRVGAGDWVEMKGELRLDHNAIVPIRVQDKVLFIPVLAFTAHYGWDGDHRGYSAAAFIVGQESDPPQERMAPFRLDLGPRQFKSIGSRLGQSALVT